MDWDVYIASRPSWPLFLRTFTGQMSDKAAKKLGYSPVEWYGWLFTKADQGGLFVRGAPCPMKTRGPRKGEPNFRHRDKTRESTVYLSEEECLCEF